MTIRIEYSNMLETGTPGAITEAAWTGAATKFGEARTLFRSLQSSGDLGFLDLATPLQPKLDLLRRFADGVGQAFADVVVLGIGGSALGTIALRSALRSPEWNALSDEERSFFPRLHVLENVDPSTMAALLERLDLARALFIVISKSGGTAETMAQYLIVRERLTEQLGDAQLQHLVFITDPKKGALRRLAEDEGRVTFEIPPNVGGRFSVLSPVGLFPLALAGADINALLAGAADMAVRCQGDDLATNPAGVYAMLQWMADTELGCHNHVLMPYADALREFSAWFVQLWAESLGKKRSDGQSVGPTPMAALGTTDQHSQVQLFMEGPRDKTVSFISVGDLGVDITIPKLHADIPELAYLGGHSLKELLDAERLATASALARRGRPNMTIEIDRIDAWHLGGLIMLLECATVYAAGLYGIDPLNQPGVELGKQLTYALLDRPDAEDARTEWNSIPQPTPRRVG